MGWWRRSGRWKRADGSYREQGGDSGIPSKVVSELVARIVRAKGDAKDNLTSFFKVVTWKYSAVETLINLGAVDRRDDVAGCVDVTLFAEDSLTTYTKSSRDETSEQRGGRWEGSVGWQRAVYSLF